jgi:hypothetical protein
MNTDPSPETIVPQLQPGEVVPVVFDDSTAYLREMRRRAETPEDSDIILELETPDVVADENP